MTALSVKWTKCTGNQWCNFSRVKLDNLTTKGVYVIWKSGTPATVVRIGQGSIADRIRAHRADPQITKHGDLLVTWAAVASEHRDGVERYLADQYAPLVGGAFPSVDAIPVNLPGAA